MVLPDRSKLWKPSDEASFIIAYGSNLIEARMKARCPSAEAFGTSTIYGYRMLFKHSCTGAYATIEQVAKSYVPVVIYRMTTMDEARPDRFEGFPRYYRKQELLLPVCGKNRKRRKNRVSGVAYIMREHRLLGEPTDDYFSLLDEGYDRWGFDREVLFKALEDSIGKKEANMWLNRFYADIVPSKGRVIPVLVWEISEMDEKNLDTYEGYPSYYTKRELPIRMTDMNGKYPRDITAMVYVMTEGHDRLRMPMKGYYDVLAEGYERFGFNSHLLGLALKEAKEAEEDEIS